MPAKALVPLGGEAMLSRVARALIDYPGIGRIIVLTQDAALLTGQADTAWLASHPAISFEASGDSVSGAVAAAVERHPESYPFLVVTADHALLDAAMLKAFILPAVAADADIAVAVVERKVLEARYPGNRRTWLKFRGGAYSGANLFLLESPRAMRALALWQGIEQQRKKGRAVVAAFGPLILAGVALRLLSLRGALRLAGKRLDLTAVAVPLPIAEACIDIDKAEDHALASEILTRPGG